MGEELETTNLFIARDDGTYVPFKGIPEAQFIDDADINCIDTICIPDSDMSLTITINTKSRSYRKIMKSIKKQRNIFNRWTKRYKRQKEKDRRHKLKND